MINTPIDNPFLWRLSKPEPKLLHHNDYHGEKNISPEYISYKENMLMMSGDVETHPGPLSIKKITKFTHSLIITLLLIIIISNKVRTSKESLHNLESPSLQQQAISTMSQLHTSQFKRNNQTFQLKKNKRLPPSNKSASTYITGLLLLILAGDVCPNPGPTKESHPLLDNISDNEMNLSVTCESCQQRNSIQSSQHPGKSFEWICENPFCKPNHYQRKSPQKQETTNRYQILTDNEPEERKSKKRGTKKIKCNTEDKGKIKENKYYLNQLPRIRKGEYETRAQREEKRRTKEKKKLRKNSQKSQRSNETESETNENKYYFHQLPKVSKEAYKGKDYCGICWTTIKKRKLNIKCWECKNSVHRKCSDINKKLLDEFRSNKKLKWFCKSCRQPENNNFARANVTILKPEEAPATLMEMKEEKASKDYLVIHMNCRSINHKEDEIKMVLDELKPDILCLTETWMDTSNPKQTFESQGYKVLRKDRTEGFKQLYGKSNGGGVAIIHRRNQKIKIKDIAGENEEVLWIQVQTSNPFMLGLIYRASYTSLLKEEQGQTSLGRMLEKASLITNNVITIGDFNCDTSAIKKTDETKRLEDVHEVHNLHQQITAPTRITDDKKSTIDHIWSNPLNNLIKTTGTMIGISDHLGVYMKLNTKREEQKPNTIKFRNYKNYDAKSFKEDIKEQLSESEVHNKIKEGKLNEALEELSSILINGADKHAPIKEIKQTKEKPYVPWMTSEIKKEREAKNILIKMNYLQPRQSDKQEIKRLKNQLNHAKRKNKRAYYKKKLAEYKGDSKNTWKVFKELLNKQEIKETIEPDIMNKEKANRFNHYFATIGTEIKNKLGITDTHVEYKEGFSFTVVSEETVGKLIDKIRIGVATGADGISARILKDSKEVILPTLTLLVNLSFKTNIFPESLKTANIKCLHKKDSTEEPSNYRPISILPVLSKVFEREAVNQIVHYLESNNLISKNQHAYRKGHSTITSLFEVTNYIYREIDQGQTVGMASLDLSKAFDSISHTHLLQKLTNIGLGQNVVEWMKSYLTNRTQRIKFSSVFSETETVTSGVPQGSILGPILFIIFTNDLITAFNNEIHVVSYADDTQLLVTGKTLNEIKKKIESTIKIAQKWYEKNSLMSNPAKTEIILFKSKQGKKEDISIKVEENDKEVELKPSEVVKVLGVHLDEHLSFSKQVKHIQGKATAATKNLFRIRELLPIKHKKMLYDSLIASNFNYADIIWGGCTKNKDELQVTQNFAMRTILGTDRRSSAKEALEKLRYLNLEGKRQVHEGVFVHKAINGNQPEEICNKYMEQMSRRNTRSATRMVLNNPKHKTALYERSPLYRTIQSWNSIPTDIKTTPAPGFKTVLQRRKIGDLYGGTEAAL